MKTIASILAIITLVALAACGKPALPIAVSFREAALEKSLVAVIHNNSGQSLKVSVTCFDKGGSSETTKEFLLEPAKPFEIGWLQGWSFLPGEKIVVRSAGYSELVVKVP